VPFDLLPPLPAVAVTQPRTVPFDLLPAVTQIRVAAQLFPMPLPARIDVTSRASLRADLLPQNVQPPLPPGTQYGVRNRNSRITLRMHGPTIVAVRDGRNRVFIDRKLDPGDTYRVPNRGGLWLTALDARAVEILLDGSSVGFAGAEGASVKDLPLNPQRFGAREPTRTSARPVSARPTRATPARATPSRAAPNRATGKSRVRTRTTR
jgi:cytoskeleton protein RodZ